MRPDAAQPPAERPFRRVVVFTTIGLALLMMSVDNTIVATALDAIQQGLDTSINWAGWTITAYSFGFVLMLPVSGKLSERFGRRTVFVYSVIVFTLASLFCGIVDNIYLLIALRALQAAGGAGFTPSATGIVVDYFGQARDRAVSLFSSIFPIGIMIGPIFGGLFVTYWTWRGVFLVNVPIGAAVAVLAMRYIPRDPPRPDRARLHIDALGIALLGVGVLSGMLAASYLGGADARVWSPIFIVPLVIATITLVAFFRHVNRSPNPFILPRLIHGPGFGAVNLLNGLYTGVTGGMIALIPLYAITRYDFNALDSGTLLVAEGVAAIALSIVGAMVLRRTGHRLPLYIGGSLMAVSMILLAVRPSGISPYVWLAGATFLIGVGAGTINPASRNAGLQLAPEHSATLAALRTMSLAIGSILTISVATAIFAASDDAATSQAWFFAVVGFLLVLGLPIIRRVPDHRGAW